MTDLAASIAVTPAVTEPSPADEREVGRRIVGSAMLLLSTQPITWTATLLAATMVPHFLGDIALGHYAFAITLTSLISVCASLGIPDYLVKRGAATGDSHVSGATAAVLLGSILSIVALFVGAAAYILPLPVPIAILHLTLVGMVPNVVYGIVLAVLRGQERHRLYAWMNAILTLGSTSMGLIILTLGGGLEGLLGASVLTSTIAACVGWQVAGLKVGSHIADVGLWRQLVTGGRPFLGASLALRVYGDADRILIGVLAPSAVVGWYAAAYRIIGIPVFIPALITIPLLPALANLQSKGIPLRPVIGRSLFAVLLLTVPLSAVTASLSPAIPTLLRWPQSYAGAEPLIAILALHLPIVAIDMVLGTVLIAIGRERSWMYIGFAMAVCNPIANILFIPIAQDLTGNGAIAAATITLGTEIAMLLLMVRLVPHGLVTLSDLWTGCRIIACGAVLASIACFLRDRSISLAVIVSSGAYVIAALATRTVRVTDVRYILVSVGLDRLFNRRHP